LLGTSLAATVAILAAILSLFQERSNTRMEQMKDEFFSALLIGSHAILYDS
jgi:hypothetical protein